MPTMTRHARLRISTTSYSVMPGLDPGIHVLTAAPFEGVDGRDKPGHDGGKLLPHAAFFPLAFLNSSNTRLASRSMIKR